MAEHNSFGDAPDYGDPGWERVPEWDEPDRARREAQRQANVEIGEGSNDIPTATIHTTEEMLSRFVLITDGSQVAPIDRPQAVLALRDFSTAFCGSKTATNGGKDGKQVKMVPTTKLWLEHSQRMEAEELTFRAGGQRITPAPNSGRRALNIWTPTVRPDAPVDWQKRAAMFIDHIHWLWGDDSGAFIDWLAHIEQQPGVLPHYGWVHISREHGKGRNWISSVLTRVWCGSVAASLDLVSIMDGGFNGRMSRKTLAIVDEINEGGNASYKHAQKLRQIVTEEHRTINPKYGRQRFEYNACRWLMFSNHTGAIPLGEEDRRFWVVAHEGHVREKEYYERLYHQLNDPLFILAVAEFLKRRDLAGFKPGQHPPMTAAKAELIAFGQTDDDAALSAVVANWPVDIITGMELTNLIGGGAATGATRHAYDRAGIRRLGGAETKVKVPGQGAQRAYAVRNFRKWDAADHHARKTEIGSMSYDEKASVLYPDAD